MTERSEDPDWYIAHVEALPALIARLRAAETERDEAVELLRTVGSHIDDRWWQDGEQVDAFLARVDGEQTT